MNPVSRAAIALFAGAFVHVPANAAFDPAQLLQSNGATDGASDNDDYCNIAGDGSGNLVVVWQSNNSLGGTIGTDLDIFVARSNDGGASWSPPSVLNDNAATDSGDDDQPRIWTDRDGKWMSIWRSSDTLGGTLGSDRDVLYSLSSDNGQTWNSPAPISSSFASDSGDDSEPVAALSESGTWIVAWHSNQSVVNSTAIGTDIDILYSVSADAGTTWTSAAILNSDAAVDAASVQDRRVSLAWAGDTTWVAAWDSVQRSGADADLYYSRSIDDGASWSAPVALNTDSAGSGDDWGVDLLADPSFGVGAAWYSNQPRLSTGSDYDIFVMRTTDGGQTWDSVRAVNSDATTDSGDDSFPRWATNGSGAWSTTWWSTKDVGGTIGTDNDVFFSASIDSGENWSAFEIANSTAAVDLTASETSIVPCYDGTGGWIVIWGSTFDLASETLADRDVQFARTAQLPLELDGFAIE